AVANPVLQKVYASAGGAGGGDMPGGMPGGMSGAGAAPSSSSGADQDCGTSTLQDGTYSQSRGVQIERELQEFITLRDKVYNIVRWAHRDRHCDFGGKVADLLVFGPNPDGPFLGLFGSKRASNTLQNFVTGILHLTVKCPSNANQCDCAGLSLVPEIAYSFLFDPAPFTNTHVELVDA
ncbi:hypothetical protein PC117_g22500, partial [Phytophthora cactorum]